MKTINVKQVYDVIESLIKNNQTEQANAICDVLTTEQLLALQQEARDRVEMYFRPHLNRNE